MTDFQQQITELKQVVAKLDEISHQLFLKGVSSLDHPLHAAWVLSSEAAIKAEEAYHELQKD